MTLPLLITGGSGQIGGACARIAKAQGIAAHAPSRAELDLSDPASIRAAMRSGQWSAVINCAAYTAVDKAESDEAAAFAINAEAPRILAEESAALGIPIIHVSTDYVFDGGKPSPYVEGDPIAPVSVYGASKAAGEAAVRAGNPNHAIIRTAWVLSAGGANFLNTMLRLGETRDTLSVVDDQFGCPSSADDIAAALLAVTQNMGERGGTWHFTNAGQASWFDLASFIFAEAAQAGLKTPMLTPITTAEYPTPAQRPANSRLDTATITRDFGLTPRDWQMAVTDILNERLGVKEN